MAKKKTRRGWGSVTKLKGGGYRVRYTALDGRRRQKTLATAELAEDFLAKTKLEMQRERIHGPASRVEPVTFREYMPRFIKRIGDSEAQSTCVTYSFRLREIAKYIGDKQLHTITTKDLDQVRSQLYRNGLHGRPRADSTVNNHFDTLKAMWRAARIDGHVDSDPIAGVSLKRPEQKELYVMSAAQKERLIRYAHPEIVLPIELALETGMRTGEIHALNLRQLRLDRPPNGEIFIPKSKSRKQRWIPLTRRARSIIDRLIENAPDDGKLVPFSKRQGRWRRLWLRSVANAKLGDFPIRFHGLRDHFAVEVLEAGVPVQNLRRIMGTSLRVALKYADHVRLNYRASTVEQVEAHREKGGAHEDRPV